MKITIQFKIVMIYLCTILMIMLISGSFIVYNTEKRDFESLQKNIEKIATYIENIYPLEPEEIKYTLSGIGENEVYMLDATGKVMWGSGKDGLDEGTLVKEGVVIRAMNSKSSEHAKVQPFATSIKKRKYIDYARPILGSYREIEAIIYIKTDTSQVYANMNNIIKTIITSLIASMFIMGVIGIIFAKVITDPIKQLTVNAKKLATGNSIKRIPINANDEIGELTQSFNYMASQLSNTMEAVTSEKNKLEKIFEHMADGVMAFNRQGMLIHVNSVCYDMIGIFNMGHRFKNIFENIDLEVDFEKLLEGEIESTNEKLVEINDKYLSMYFDVYMNAKKEPDGLVVVIQDVTKQQKLDHMRKEFVANVSHELRTPLTTVKSYTETLIDGAIDDRDTALHFLNVMEKEADRMTALVQDLLELSRIDNKQIQLQLTKLNLRSLLEETLEVQVINIDKNGHKLVYEVDDEKEYYIEGDVARLKQIIHNILSNAIKYSVEPGTIKVELFEEKEFDVLRISDTGIGIPQKDLPRIFERFYRVDKARSRKLGGTGLGLAIAKELIELHEGTIRVESKSGEGTTVEIYLKVCEENI